MTSLLRRPRSAGSSEGDSYERTASLQSISGGLGPSRGREAACTPEDSVNQAAGLCKNALLARQPKLRAKRAFGGSWSAFANRSLRSQLRRDSLRDTLAGAAQP